MSPVVYQDQYIDKDRKSPFVENKKLYQKKQEFNEVKDKNGKDSLQSLIYTLAMREREYETSGRYQNEVGITGHRPKHGTR